MSGFNRTHQHQFSLLISFIRGLFCVFLYFSVTSISLAQEAQLTIDDGRKVTVWSQKELFSHPDTRQIIIKNDPSYHREMHYRALPVLSVLPDLASIDTLQFVALDGFVANLKGRELAGAGMPMIAIEDYQHRWPDLPNLSSAGDKSQALSAGPFYLVWLNPVQGKIGNEQWPYQIKAIKAAQRLEQRFPQMLPQATKPLLKAQTLRGMAVYLKTVRSVTLSMVREMPVSDRILIFHLIRLSIFRVIFTQTDTSARIGEELETGTNARLCQRSNFK